MPLDKETEACFYEYTSRCRIDIYYMFYINMTIYMYISYMMIFIFIYKFESVFFVKEVNNE